MRDGRASSGTDDSEDARAFLQDRVATLWKIVFFFLLIATVLGLKGPLKDPGFDLVLDVAGTAEAGAMWWFCRRGRRSVRLLRILDPVVAFVMFATTAMLGRYVLVGFVRDQKITTAEGVMMTDAYMGALSLIGNALLCVIRAGIIPTSPRRTALYTALFCVPNLVTSVFIVPTAHGFMFRPADSRAFPWLPATVIMMFAFIVFTSAMTSHVIFGLRKEVREARRLGQYVLEQKIGEGGMGEVYRARHGMIRRPSAIKLLRGDQAHAGSIARFEREVQQTARLTHPNTITIFDYGRTDDGTFYYAMELLDGANLQQIVNVGGPQPAARVVHILAMACGALTEAHGIGLIHRDIKPANMILCTRGGERDVLKLVDFGLVKELKVDEDLKLTGARTLTGSPEYMAPEAIRASDSVDARTDIYALGAVGYFLLAGTELFDGKSLVEVCSQHLHQQPAPFATRNVVVPAELEAIILACLEKDPARRPQSAAELRHRLDGCGVAPWDSERANAWWSKHRAAAESAPIDVATAKTILVDGARRS
ncbi:MAG: serine/threonine protein kinase [Deltaproteobacteria bacterium]|nr:serine/threonine protein kinase [Deltaproteobacteria bacterium]